MFSKKINTHLDNHIKVVKTINDEIETLKLISNEMIECFKNNGKILICGNGGSASDAQHIAAELVGRFQEDRIALPAISLSTDTSILTAVSNDYSYENIFERQISALAKKEDIVLVLSTSGSSKNIIRAVKCANIIGCKTIGFLEKKGLIEDDTDIAIKIKSCDTAIIQECHIILGHIICALIDDRYSKSNDV